MSPSPFDRLREGVDRLRGVGRAVAEAPGEESTLDEESPISMSKTDSHLGEEAFEAVQNTDPVSDPADDVVTLSGAETDGAAFEKLDKLVAERDALVDRLARTQAEFENARRRAEREKAEFRDFAVSGAVEQFLPVLDNFALALKSTGTAEQLRTGVELIVKQMEEVLRNLNVQVVETVGVQFDPKVHEALGQVESLELPDGQVMDEIRRGYKIKDRLLRPAMVRVVSNPGQKGA